MFRRGFIGSIVAAITSFLYTISPIESPKARSERLASYAEAATPPPYPKIEMVSVKAVSNRILGNDVNDCDITYDVYELNHAGEEDKLLGRDKSPCRGRYAKTQYTPGKWGTLTTLPCGKKLLDVMDEMPTTEAC